MASSLFPNRAHPLVEKPREFLLDRYRLGQYGGGCQGNNAEQDGGAKHTHGTGFIKRDKTITDHSNRTGRFRLFGLLATFSSPGAFLPPDAGPVRCSPL